MSQKINFHITGMHCKACELLNEQNLRALPDVTDAKLDHRSGRAEITYEKRPPTRREIKNVLAPGYRLAEEGIPQKTFQKNKANWQLLVPLLILLYWLAGRLSYLDFGGFLSGDFSLPFAALIGLAAGFSTCLALVGGLVFGLATTYAQKHPDASRRQKFLPHIFFNLGRIVGFFVFGGLLGLAGSFFRLSPLYNGLLTVFVGLVILLLGLKLLRIFPALDRFELALPKSLGRRINSHNPALLGALTFFLPCGFTQAMQIYALSSGSFLSGGLIMALFALGTAPGLLSIGGLVSLIKQKEGGAFFKIAGVVLVLFAFFNLQNGWRLVQLGGQAGNRSQAGWEELSRETEGVQIVRMTESNRGYTPNRFDIVAGKPVRWIIDAQAPYSCASYLIVPTLGIERQLKKGENIIEFMPENPGIIHFSCGMGMYNGAFHVAAE